MTGTFPAGSARSAFLRFSTTAPSFTCFVTHIITLDSSSSRPIGWRPNLARKVFFGEIATNHSLHPDMLRMEDCSVPPETGTRKMYCCNQELPRKEHSSFKSTLALLGPGARNMPCEKGLTLKYRSLKGIDEHRHGGRVLGLSSCAFPTRCLASSFSG